MKKYILLLLMPLMLTACATSASEPLAETRFLLGAVSCNIKLYTGQSQDTLNKAFARIAEVERAMSATINNSEVSEINGAAGKYAISIGADTLTVIKKGLYYSEQSDGAFDISIGPLTNLWHIGFDDARVPAQAEIDAVLTCIDYRDVDINEIEGTVFLKREGMALDLGAIAKGYAADAVAAVLKENCVTSAIIDLGGDIYALGTNNGKSWRIGIKAPDGGGIVGVVRCADKAVVTSGIYERWLEGPNGVYHHILNPYDGYPYDNELASVTIISGSTCDGDGLATAAFSKGIEGGMEFVTKNEADAIFITKDRNVYLTDGIKDDFELTNSEYKIIY